MNAIPWKQKIHFLSNSLGYIFKIYYILGSNYSLGNSTIYELYIPRFLVTISNKNMEYNESKNKIIECLNIMICCCCSVTHSCPTLCNPVDCSTPGFPVIHYLLQFVQTLKKHQKTIPIITSHICHYCKIYSLKYISKLENINWIN